MSLIDSFTELSDCNSDQEEAANNLIKGKFNLSAAMQEDYIMVESTKQTLHQSKRNPNQDLMLSQLLLEKSVLFCQEGSSNEVTKFIEIIQQELQEPEFQQKVNQSTKIDLLQKSKYIPEPKVEQSDFLQVSGTSQSKYLIRSQRNRIDSNDDFVDVNAVMEDENKVTVNMKLFKLNIDQSYIETLNADFWRKVFDENEKSEYDLENDYSDLHFELRKAISLRRLQCGVDSRALAWPLLLNISKGMTIIQLYKDYLQDAFDLTKSTIKDEQIQKQIRLDIPRTFAELQIPQFTVPHEEGENSLYNVLVAFSKHCPEVGYCQGMNYLAALILIGINFDESLAFAILVKLMLHDNKGKHNLSGLYSHSLQTLLDMSDQVYAWLMTEPKMAQIEKSISESGLPFNTLLAGPFMAIFANLIDLDSSLHVLDRLILDGKSALIEIVKHCLMQMRAKLLLSDQDQCMHQYLIKQVYIDALALDEFFPVVQL